MKINTTPGETYIVLSTGGCTVTTGAGKQIKKLAAGQDFFTAMTGDSIISDDNASVTVAKGEILSMLNTDSTGSDVQATLRFQPVTSQSALPATGENGVIYLVPNGKTAPNQYTEWVWTGAAYEQLGDASVDLSGYAKLNAANTFTTTQKFDAGLEAKGGISLQNTLTLGKATLSASNGTLNIANISKVHTLNLDASYGRIERITIVDCIYPSENLAIGSSINILTYNEGSLQTELILGDGVRYRYYSRATDGSTNTLSFGDSSMLSLELGARLYCGYDEHGICMYRREGTAVATLDIGPHAQLNVPGVNGDGIRMYTDNSGVATLSIGSNAKVIGLAYSGGSDSSSSAGIDTLRAATLEVINIHSLSLPPNNVISFGSAHITNVTSLAVDDNGYVRTPQLKSLSGFIYVPELRGSEASDGHVRVSGVLELTGAGGLVLKENTGISGPGWDAIVADIQVGAAAAVAAESEQESFTKLIFPPTGTATAEQDPSWITKKNILMETSGGQLNMTHLTETLAYAAQNRFDIAKRIHCGSPHLLAAATPYNGPPMLYSQMISRRIRSSNLTVTPHTGSTLPMSAVRIAS